MPKPLSVRIDLRPGDIRTITLDKNTIVILYSDNSEIIIQYSSVRAANQAWSNFYDGLEWFTTDTAAVIRAIR
jgi:hypothetical protein